jgi:hypothetical protein
MMNNLVFFFFGQGSIRNWTPFCTPSILAKMGTKYLNINHYSFLSKLYLSPVSPRFILPGEDQALKTYLFHFKKPHPGIFAKFHLLNGFFDELGFYSFLALKAIFDGFF